MQVEKTGKFDEKNTYFQEEYEILSTLPGRVSMDSCSPLRFLWFDAGLEQDVSAPKGSSVLFQKCKGYRAKTLAEVRSYLTEHTVDVMLVSQSLSTYIYPESIRQLKFYADVPILAVLAQESKEIIRTAFDSGVQDYLTLSNLQEPDVFIHALKHAIVRHHSAQALLPNPQLFQELECLSLEAKNLSTPLVRESCCEDGTNYEDSQRHAMLRFELALRTSELKFSRLTANIPGVIFQYIQYPDGTDVMPYISPRCKEIYGVEAEAVMKDSSAIWAVLHPEDVASLQIAIAASKQTLQTFAVEFRVIHPDGQIRWLQITSVPESLENGAVSWEGFSFDITERKHAEQLQQQYLIELKTWRNRYEEAGLVSGQILFEWDVLTNQPTWGKNTAHILGYSSAEMPSALEEWIDLIHVDDQERFKNELDVGLSKQGFLRLEYRIRHQEGHYIWVEDKTQMLMDAKGNPERLIGFVGDVTGRKQSEIALRESEIRFRLLSELAPIGIFHADLEGKTIYENPYLQAMSGFSEEQSPHRCWMDLLHPDDLESVSQSFQQFIQDRSVQDQSSWFSEFRLVISKEKTCWVLGQATILLSDSGLIRGYMGTVTDITDQKRAEIVLQRLNDRLEQLVADRTHELQQSNLKLRIENTIRKHHVHERQRAELELHEAKDQLQAVLDAVPGCVAWVDSDLKYLGVNQLMADTFGRSPEDFVEQDVTFLQESVPGFAAFIKQFFSECHISATGELELSIDRKVKHCLVVAQRYLQGQAAVFVGIDITDRKRAELEIQKALEKTQELSELKSRFISIASHEFRTPLTTIFSASELIETYGERWPREKELKYLKQIQSSVEHMTGLLDDVLLISAGEAGKLKLEPSSLNIVEFCQTLTEELKLGKNCRHVLNFNYSAETQQVNLDEKLLRHILSNLLSNAVKYSPEHQPIEFNLTVDFKTITFAIADQGIGIPAEDQLHLFDLFHRAGNVGTIAGTGLGLSIVKKAVELHGGTIDVKSEVGVGTQFTVSLPIDQLRGEYQW
jgi:PAS domain S-box-containing protein